MCVISITVNSAFACTTKRFDLQLAGNLPISGRLRLKGTRGVIGRYITPFFRDIVSVRRTDGNTPVLYTPAGPGPLDLQRQFPPSSDQGPQ